MAVSKFSYIHETKVKTIGHRFEIPRGNKLWHMCGAHVPKIGTLIPREIFLMIPSETKKWIFWFLKNTIALCSDWRKGIVVE